MRNLRYFAAITALAAAGMSNAAVFHYDNFALDSERWDIPDPLVINTADLYLLRGDEASTITLCQPPSEFMCFTSGELSFAVPKAPITNSSEWSVSGAHYEVTSNSSIEILGVHATVFRIRSMSRQAERIEYLYSNDLGLIAIDTFSQDRARVTHYILREPTGFGAKSPNNSFKPKPLRGSA